MYIDRYRYRYITRSTYPSMDLMTSLVITNNCGYYLILIIS